MSEIPVEITDRALEPKVPEVNSTEKGEKVFRRLKIVTKKGSKITRKGERSERSLGLRAHRAELYKKIVKTEDPEKRQQILKEAHARDEIESQYLSQGELTVDLPGLGEQTSRYTMIEPPEGRKLPGEQYPVFLIPGASNDINSVGNLVKEIAYQGRSVIVVGMPDSQMGITTEAFAKEVKESPTMEPHAIFFKTAINKLVGEDASFELWGMSAGSMITAEILNDPKYQERVRQAVLLSPAGTSEHSKNQQNFGVATESIRVYGKPSRGVHYPLYIGNNKDQKTPVTAGDIFKTVIQKAREKFEPYQSMKVADGGQITVVSGTKDNMTRSRESDEDFRSHPQVELISVQGGVHNTPIIEAGRIVPEVFEKQKLAEVRSELS